MECYLKLTYELVNLNSVYMKLVSNIGYLKLVSAAGLTDFYIKRVAETGVGCRPCSQ